MPIIEEDNLLKTMLRDYQVVSPSLEGVLNHEALSYENIRRPSELMRILDGPAAKSPSGESFVPDISDRDRIVLEEYFHDLYGVFMKKLSYFVVDSTGSVDDTVKLQAMLQEMIKVKRLLKREGSQS